MTCVEFQADRTVDTTVSLTVGSYREVAGLPSRAIIPGSLPQPMSRLSGFKAHRPN
jgi:hypothetical protein